MADVSEGLSTGESVESDKDFTAALAKAAGVEIPPERLASLEEGDTSVKAGLTFGESAPQGRDDEGRFAPATPEVSEPKEGEAPAEEVDPNLAALLDKHEGDAAKALAEVLGREKEAQSTIGKQSNEVGELRERLARLEGRDEARAATHAPAPLPAVGLDTINEQVAEHDGPAVIQWYSSQGFPDGHAVYDAAFQAWLAQDDTGAAQAAYTRYQAALNAPASPGGAQSPTEDPWVAQKKQQEQFDTTLGSVASSYKEAEWGLIAPHLVAVLEDAGTPQIIKDAVQSSDQKTVEQGLHSIAQIARGRAIAEATATATAENAAKVLETKKSAQVATGSLRVVNERQSGSGEELTSAERQERFRQSIVSAETTSVRDGLVFAKS